MIQENSTYKPTGILATLMFHVIIALLFVYFGFHTPLPLPPEEGILVNFGETPTGSGTVEPNSSPTPEKQEVKPTATPDVKEEKGTLTQDYEEAPAIKTPKEVKKVKKDIKPEKKEVKKTETKPKEEPKPVVEERKTNPLAMYHGNKNSSSSSEGITEGKGNQGEPNGVEGAKNYTGSGKGNTGIRFDLEGRNQLALPAPAYNSQVEGTVVVEITVDKEGNVTNAVPGVKGSTTLEGSLLEAARQAALKAKFNRKPDAAAYQKGKITYIFKLQ